MRKMPFISIVGMMILFALPVVAQADTMSTKRQIQAAYNSISRGYARRDSAAILAKYTDNFVSIDKDGIVDSGGKDAEREHLAKVFSRATRIDDKVTILSVRMEGKNAIVTIRENYTRTMPDIGWGIGKYHSVGASRDYWVSTPQGWRLSRSREIQRTVTKTLNGRPAV